jgi:hypothetical protein
MAKKKNSKGAGRPRKTRTNKELLELIETETIANLEKRKLEKLNTTTQIKQLLDLVKLKSKLQPDDTFSDEPKVFFIKGIDEEKI